MSDRTPVDLQLGARFIKLLKVGGDDLQAVIDRRGGIATVRRAIFERPEQKAPKPTDLLLGFRRRKLPVILSREIETAFRTEDGKDPLGLGSGWTKELLPQPLVIDGHEITPDWLVKYTKFIRATKEYGETCTPIPFLALTEVGGKPTSLRQLYQWFGTSHDDKTPGPDQAIRPGIQYSHWMLSSKYNETGWAINPVVLEPTLSIGYWPWPEFLGNKNWETQKKITEARGLSVMTAPLAMWFLEMAIIADLAKLDGILARTSTEESAGNPLVVRVYSGGVSLYRYWICSLWILSSGRPSRQCLNIKNYLGEIRGSFILIYPLPQHPRAL